MIGLIEALFKLLSVLITGLFSVLGAVFVHTDKQRPYNSKFLPYLKRVLLLNRWNKGIAFGIRKISIKTSSRSVLVVGKSGAGKSSSVIMPSILQGRHHMVITDVDGSIYNATSGYLHSKGYNIQVLNLKDVRASLQFNPIAFCKTDSDLKKLSEMLIETAFPDTSGESKFWEYGGQDILYFLLRFLQTQPKKYQNLSNVRHLLNHFERLSPLVSEKSSSELFEDYEGICATEQKILSSFVTTAKTALDKLAHSEVAHLTAKNTLNLKTLTKRRKAVLYVIVPEVKLKFYEFLLSLFYQTLFDYVQIHKPKRKLFFYLDEAGNINMGKDTFPVLSTVVRRYNSSLVICVQGLAQLTKLYGKEGAETIINGSCYTKVYFGGMSVQLATELSRAFGRYSESLKMPDQKYSSHHSRELLTIDELIQLKNEYALIVFGNKPPVIIKMRPYFRTWRLKSRSKRKAKPLKKESLQVPERLTIPKPLN